MNKYQLAEAEELISWCQAGRRTALRKSSEGYPCGRVSRCFRVVTTTLVLVEAKKLEIEIEQLSGAVAIERYFSKQSSWSNIGIVIKIWHLSIWLLPSHSLSLSCGIANCNCVTWNSSTCQYPHISWTKVMTQLEKRGSISSLEIFFYLSS